MPITVLQQVLPTSHDGNGDYKPRVASSRLISTSRVVEEAVLWDGWFYGGSINYPALTEAEFAALDALFLIARLGPKAVLYFNYRNYSFTDVICSGTVNGSNKIFQLRQSRTVGSDVEYKTVRHPIHNGLSVTAAGQTFTNTVTATVDNVAATIDSVDETTGLITLNAAPTGGQVVRASGKKLDAVIFEDESLPQRRMGLEYAVEGLRLLEVNA